MSNRNGKGNAWKYRNGKPRTARKMSLRRSGFEPQWKVKELWQNPFKEERRYATDGLRVWTEWIPVPVAKKTGVRIFDEWLQYLTEGKPDMGAFCKRYDGLKTSDLDALAFVLTGMSGQRFQTEYRLLTLDALLRYTTLPPDEVARRSGFGSKNNLYLTCKREYGTAAMERRKSIQQKGDVGRYR